MYCKYCGQQIDNDSEFCRYCGKNQSDELTCKMEPSQCQEDKTEKKTNVATSQMPNQNKNNTLKYALGITIGIILIVFVIWGALSLFGGGKIADITIDKVTPELAHAVKGYDELFSFSEGLACVKKGDKYGFIDKLGHEIIPCMYDGNSTCYNKRIIVKRGDKEGCINIENETVIPFIYDEIEPFNDSVSVACLEGKYGVIDLNGNVILPFENGYVYSFTEGLAGVSNKEGRWGYVDKKGNVVIDYKYEDIGAFSEGWAFVRYNGRRVFIDKLGNIVLEPNTKWDIVLRPWTEGKIPVIVDWSPYRCAYMDRKGNLVSDIITGSLESFDNGYAEVEISNKFGLIDSKGVFILPCKYDFVGRDIFHKWYSMKNNKGLVYVANEGRVGFFNTQTLKFSIPLEYESIGIEFSEGLVCAERNSKGGFIDMENNIVIPFVYDVVGDFSEGFAVVKRYGKYGYVDRYGKDTFE